MTLTGSLQIDLNTSEFAHLRRSRSDNPPLSLPVTFPRTFATPPVVMLGLTGFHGGGDPFNFRFEPSQVTDGGFNVVLSTNRNWVESLQISWIATDA
ncbi:H-type lectin domain-containing protein [Granulicella arctica]|uniref:H-type lectin domain-containing protein n=1 Tax=Granulicella arctica TaxID=940613 RepID=UPI0021E09123|nr:H-type lectin domain-containing protein [Granulicella arctica]